MPPPFLILVFDVHLCVLTHSLPTFTSRNSTLEIFADLGQLLSHLPRYPQTKKLKIMNLNPASQTERACVLTAPGAARCNARRVEIFSGDSIPTLLRLASEAPRSFGPLKSGALQRELTGVNRR